ncbi:NIPSNAP protein [Algoriphagus boseongensis]|uniref:NIPSNAP protein n=1 Tax=Algoriphagus boseongensis TaxID=1442587 RepID=A0A4R6T3N9_9BACT|nr:NIPSNAP family protein [Algoriphagus boseongensis]TDQ15121.1 NIPSNAP protein [Algoriphagus boseongensis]
MKKIMLLALAFFMAFGAFAQLPKVSKSKYFEIRKYYAHPGKLPDLIKRFENHTMKLFEKAGMENIIYFIPDENTDNSMTYILGYPDEASREASWEKFLNDPEWKAAYEASHVNGPLVAKIDQTFMVLAPELNDTPIPTGSGIFQMRTYYCFPGKIENIQARFRDHTRALFEKQGLKNYPYWLTVEKDGSQPKLVYLLGHDSKDAFNAAFDRFRTDPEWIKARDASEASGKIVEKVDAIFFKTLPFSPMK